MNLNQKLLDAARDEVALKAGFINWENVAKRASPGLKVRLIQEAALLAMEKQAEFYRWASQKYVYMESHKKWNNTFEPALTDMYTELELYGIWEGQRNEG